MLTVKRVLRNTVHYYQCDKVVHQLKKEETTGTCLTDAGVLLWREGKFTCSTHFSTGTIYVINDHGKTIDVIRL